jgi:very-short-patch-repair endonuclease
MSLNYNKNNIILAKNLRKNATPQEKHLWYDFLSKYEVRFQRQKAIDNFIADFYCHQAKLIIEIDGSQHFTQEGIQKDRFRTEIL